jgi:DNA repair exonuclease SbcCD nuclease subunit
MTVQVLLTGDNHLDPPAVLFGQRRLERRADHLRCFEEMIRYAEQNKPDLLLLAGDVFDTIRPGNAIRARVMENLRVLHDLGVQVMAVSGDHDTPKNVDDGASPLAVYGNSGYANFFEDQARCTRKRLHIDGLDVDVYGLSRNPLLKPGEDPLAPVASFDGELNILLTHYPVEGFVGFAPHDPIIRLSSIPENCQLVGVGHFHAYQTKELQHTTIIYPGSTERASFQEENEKKGFAWIEVGKEGVVSREHIQTSARPFKTIDAIFPETEPPIEFLESVLDDFKDSSAALRLRLKGRVTAERLLSYKRSELLLHSQNKFFHLTVDESDLEIDSPNQIAALPRTTPLEELRRYFMQASQGATEAEKALLEKALRLCEARLEEAGAW